METPATKPEEVATEAVGETPKVLVMGERWPTTEEFVSEATRDEAIAVAATEILEVQAGVIKAILRAHHKDSLLPAGVRAIFDKKLRSAVAQLYAGIPNLVVQQVEMVVMTEQLGGPEAVAKMFAEAKAEEDKANGVVDSKVLDGTVNSAPSGQEASSASDAAITALPVTKPLEQIPIQLDANGVMHVVQQPVEQEETTGKVLAFKRPDTEPEPPKGGTPIAQAA